MPSRSPEPRRSRAGQSSARPLRAWLPLDSVLACPVEDLEITLDSLGPLPWADYFLNPRRLRGSDFLMRWSQGAWSERMLVAAITASGRYGALPDGASRIAPEGDVQAFERLDAAGLGSVERLTRLIRAGDCRHGGCMEGEGTPMSTWILFECDHCGDVEPFDAADVIDFGWPVCSSCEELM